MKPKIFSTLFLSCLLFYCATFPSWAVESVTRSEQSSFTLEVTDNLINLKAEQASFKEILNELEKKTGIKVKIFDGVDDKKVTLNISALPVYAVHTLLEKIEIENFAVVYDKKLDSKAVFILPKGQSIDKFIKNKKVLFVSQKSISNSSNVSTLDSPKEETIDPARTSPDPWDLRKFFQMDDPLEAAIALREHAKKHNIPLDARQSIKTPKKDKMKTPTELIRLFNGTEISPPPGIENSLSKRANRLIIKSEGSKKIIAILRTQDDMSMGEIIDLLEANVKVYESAGSSAFIVRVPASSITLLQSRSYVQWLGEYRSEYKINVIPSVSKKPGAFIYPLGGDKPEYRADLKRLGITISGYDSSANFYDVILDVSRFAEVSSLWWIKGIHKEPEEKMEAMTTVTVNFEPNDSRELIMAYKTSYTGSGVLVGVRDNAIYETHSQLSGIFDNDSELSGTEAHGTHVTGIIAGRTKTITGHWGSSNIKGVAPGASILFRQNDWSWVPNSYYFDFQSFINNSVQISNHSYLFLDWLGNPDYSYDGNSENFDAYCDNDNMVIVKSAGNQYNSRTITNPGTAKNVLTVGAIYFVSDSGEEIGRLASYSSEGPTADDSRLKPEIVAPGGGASYTRGVVSTNSNPWSVSGFSGNIDNNYSYPEWQSDDNYIRLSGTSMAAPHVTGILAKMKQWKPDFNSELMKALLINTTLPIKENSSSSLGAYANTQVGYGLVNGYSVTHQYSSESNRLLFGEDWLTEDDLQDVWTSITVPSGAKKLIVTLAYNDQEGEDSNSDALKDDLDLTLISPGGTEYHAYNYKASGVTTESPLEKMVITNPSSGNWTIRIDFWDSPGFGNPFIYAEQRYGVVAHVILKTPALSLTVPQSSIDVYPNQNFTIQPTVKNTVGYIAAGVTAKIEGSSSFGGDINKSRYVGNLMYQNASISPVFNLTAPSSAGTYTLTVEADGINKEFSSGYPKTQSVTVNVISCDVNDGWYCSAGDVREYRDYYSSGTGCDYTVTSSQDCDNGDGWYGWGDNGPGCLDTDDPTASYRDYYC